MASAILQGLESYFSGHAGTRFFSTKMSHIDTRIQTHLRHVYFTLCMTSTACAVGAITSMHVGMAGIISQLAALACLITLNMMAPTKQNLGRRTALLASFGFCQGLAIGPLISLVIDVNPVILFQASLGTAAIFLSFSASALLSQRRSYLYLGGMLASAATTLLCLRLGSLIFGRSAGLYNVELYGGLMMFAAYILFDTQMIIERAGAGDMDHVRHALDLFVNLFAIFVRVLIILLKNAQKNEDKKAKEKKRRQ